jgi:hypothetical protein
MSTKDTPVLTIRRVRVNLKARKDDFVPHDIFVVEVESKSGSWPETFGSEAELNSFLTGLRIGITMMGSRGWTRPEIPTVPEVTLSERQLAPV